MRTETLLLGATLLLAGVANADDGEVPRAQAGEGSRANAGPRTTGPAPRVDAAEAEPSLSAARATPSAADVPRATVPPGLLRGVTLGPIESSLHPDRGYGSDACARSMREIRAMGGNWVSLTPFGRVWDLKPSGIALDFEARFAENRRAVQRAVAQAHAAGLRVLLVPHLWVENGDWRALIDPEDDAGWERWARAYAAFVSRWAEVSRDAGVDMMAVGVELRSWVTTRRAPQFSSIIAQVRRIYPGPLTYAANWDDADQTVIWGDLDVIGVNAFYPLADRDGAPLEELRQGGRRVADQVRALAETWDKPVLFTEFGYTTRRDPAVRPWEWPEHLDRVVVDQLAQADAYRSLLGALLEERRFLGFFVWRFYADPDDTSQEAEWGFSPRGKLAELVLRDAFRTRWTAETESWPSALGRRSATRIGLY